MTDRHPLISRLINAYLALDTSAFNAALDEIYSLHPSLRGRIYVLSKFMRGTKAVVDDPSLLDNDEFLVTRGSVMKLRTFEDFKRGSRKHEKTKTTKTNIKIIR